MVGRVAAHGAPTEFALGGFRLADGANDQGLQAVLDNCHPLRYVGRRRARIATVGIAVDAAFGSALGDWRLGTR